MRKVPLVNGEIYHVYTKSIANFKIFRNNFECERMKRLFSYYQIAKPPFRFSAYLEIKDKKAFFQKHFSQSKKLVEIITYCVMPTHIHLMIKQLEEGGISTFMKNILNSYSRYLNLKIKRKGPLWQGRFENKLVDNEDQLLHLSRYIHLNPVSTSLKERPEDWQHSSYHYYLGLANNSQNWLSSLFDYVDIDSNSYKKFVDANIDYQRELEKIKHLI